MCWIKLDFVMLIQLALDLVVTNLKLDSVVIPLETCFGLGAINVCCLSPRENSFAS